jgi:hypothetical protein
MREGSAFAQSGCSRIKDIWNDAAKDWKGLTDMGMSHHPSNRLCKERITASIPSRPNEHDCHFRVGDWIANPTPNAGSPLDWVYLVLEPTDETATMFEFQKISPRGRIQATTNQAIKISTSNLAQLECFPKKDKGQPSKSPGSLRHQVSRLHYTRFST